jgi:hypothetical protein
MPAKDIFHDAVRTGLEKDGWVITDDPLLVKLGEQKIYVDLGAERLLAAERGARKIAVEIKSFVGHSFLDDFHHALGQFLNYRVVLAQVAPERELYLAVPVDTWQEFFQAGIAPLAVREYGLKLVVYDPQSREVVQWIS